MTGIRGNDSRLGTVQKVCLAHKMNSVNVEKKEKEPRLCVDFLHTQKAESFSSSQQYFLLWKEMGRFGLNVSLARGKLLRAPFGGDLRS